MNQDASCLLSSPHTRSSVSQRVQTKAPLWQDPLSAENRHVQLDLKWIGVLQDGKHGVLLSQKIERFSGSTIGQSQLRVETGRWGLSWRGLHSRETTPRRSLGYLV